MGKRHYNLLLTAAQVVALHGALIGVPNSFRQPDRWKRDTRKIIAKLRRLQYVYHFPE